MVKKTLFIFLLGCFIFFGTKIALGQALDCQDISDLQKKKDCLEAKVNSLKGQAKTLSSQIAIMDSQIRLTEARIEANKREILDLTLDIDTATKKISTLSDSLNSIAEVLINRIVATYQAGRVHPLEMLLSSSSASDLLARLNYLKIARDHDKKLMIDVQQAKNDYANQKEIFEAKKKKVENLKKQLETYTNQLSQEKQTKQDILAQTQGSEANYQRILAETKEQLASFSRFVTSQGGASILSAQTVCDDWGCYYNQRDGQWGNNALNGTQYTLASDGCLVTSMAMLYTHYGYKDVNPQSINSVSSNFAGIPPALLKYSISANGTSSQRIGAEIDSILSSGHPVVIGISYDRGNLADHFLVLVSGSGGNYIMNDPFTPNGRNISFRDRYPEVRIVQVNKVIF